AAPGDLVGGDACGLAGFGRSGAGRELARDCDGVVAPLAVALEPLPALVEAIELPLEALGRGAFSVGAEQDDVEARGFALRHAAFGEQRLDADARLTEQDGAGQLSLDGAACRLTQADENVSFERARG